MLLSLEWWEWQMVGWWSNECHHSWLRYHYKINAKHSKPGNILSLHILKLVKTYLYWERITVVNSCFIVRLWSEQCGRPRYTAVLSCEVINQLTHAHTHQILSRLAASFPIKRQISCLLTGMMKSYKQLFRFFIKMFNKMYMYYPHYQPQCCSVLSHGVYTIGWDLLKVPLYS